MALGDAADQRTPRLTIGEVLAVLRDDFPDVTISKIRYLESEDLVHPQRTPSGYRKFSRADVSRLRYVLAAQRDQYLPLRVIKEHLEASTAASRCRRGRRDGAGPAAGAGGGRARPQAAADAGAVRPGGRPGARAAGRLRAVRPAGHRRRRSPSGERPAGGPRGRGLARHGIEPRHLRVYRSGVEREAGPGRTAGRAGAAGPLGGGPDPGHGEAPRARDAVGATAHGPAGSATPGLLRP